MDTIGYVQIKDAKIADNKEAGIEVQKVDSSMY